MGDFGHTPTLSGINGNITLNTFGRANFKVLDGIPWFLQLLATKIGFIDPPQTFFQPY